MAEPTEEPVAGQPLASEVAIRPSMSIDTAIHQLHAHRTRLLAVTDEQGRLLGVLTAHTAQSLLLDSADLTMPVASVMEHAPTAVTDTTPSSQVRRMVMNSPHLAVPVLDSQQRLVRIATAETLSARPRTRADALILAGGLGLRMRPLTEAVPKPMLPLHGQPILRHIVEQLTESGITGIFLAVNYLADQISEYFGDGSDYGASITYLREESPLGTAGSLRLLPQPPAGPLIVMNGDVLARIDYSDLIATHESGHAHATVCTWDYPVTIPYGQVVTAGDTVLSLTEKPTLRTEISPGIYVVSPETVARVPEGRVDMPDVIADCLSGGFRVVRYRLTDLWIDIGEPREYERAQLTWHA